ncbi:hypothetical protein KSK55_02445 [Methanospirillum purgamenti]|uniref:Uncharacterized protein n=1 Tax=Methanospirillum hungatei TaxID=2203 RepID=A0A8F5ZI04_METHU|nr:hypothetical protein [Methanospirillum hungatei]QXO95293.1 hypothetical protein KSK55_02445 [Methanospirillum hungatei]
MGRTLANNRKPSHDTPLVCINPKISYLSSSAGSESGAGRPGIHSESAGGHQQAALASSKGQTRRYQIP